VRTLVHRYGLGSTNPPAYSSVTREKSKPTSIKVFLIYSMIYLVHLFVKSEKSKLKSGKVF
jgi:hypothetical protein